jgi:hypothetical protein
VELTRQRWDDFTQRPGSAGRSRDDVFCPCPSAPCILVTAVEDALIVRAGMDCAHYTISEPKVLVQHPGDARVISISLCLKENTDMVFQEEPMDFFKTLDGFEHFTDVTSLRLSQCFRLKDIKALSALKQLEQLDLIQCNALKTITALGELTQSEAPLSEWMLAHQRLYPTGKGHHVRVFDGV